MAKISVEIKKGADVVCIRARLRAHIEKAEEGGYVVYCPALGVCTQGETVREARANIIEATELFIESCFARGVLYKILAKKGFKMAGQKSAARRPPKTPANARVIHFPAEFPMAVNY